MFRNSSQDKDRSIQIDMGEVSFIDFNITSGDPTYRFLYQRGYQAANTFLHNSEIHKKDQRLVD